MKTPDTTQLGALLTVSDVATLLKMSKGAVYTRMSRGDLPHVHIGPRTVRFVAQDVIDWALRNRVLPRRTK